MSGMQFPDEGEQRARDERHLQDAYPHDYFPDECSLCGSEKGHPLTLVLIALQDELREVPTPELDHFYMAIRWFMSESLEPELFKRRDWRGRKERTA